MFSVLSFYVDEAVKSNMNVNYIIAQNIFIWYVIWYANNDEKASVVHFNIDYDAKNMNE